jgi:hypothetical protein
MGLFDEFVGYGRLGWSIVSGLWKFWRGRTRRLTPQQKLELRGKWKPQVETWIRKQYAKKLRLDVIVRDMKRMDKYPETAKGRGISAWFRVGLVDTYEKGIMLGLRTEGLVEEEGGWRFGEYSVEKDRMVNLRLVGFVPYENIEMIDWDGDDYYQFPHIYCYFDFKSQPYERLAFCERRNLDAHVYYTDIVDYEDVRRLTKKLKGRAFLKRVH